MATLSESRGQKLLQKQSRRGSQQNDPTATMLLTAILHDRPIRTSIKPFRPALLQHFFYGAEHKAKARDT